MQEPEKLSWGQKPFPDSLRSSGSSPEAQALRLHGRKDRPELRPFAEGSLLHKASQAEGSAFIGEERQEDQVWDGRLTTFIASTGEPDRNGNVLDIDGWDLANYRRNPVVLFAHNWNLPPVGKALSIGIEGRLLKATVQFAPTELGQELALLNADNYLRAISAGARPLEWEVRRDPTHGFPIGIHSHKQELIELSIVPIPANPDTLHASLSARGEPAYPELGRRVEPPWEPALITAVLGHDGSYEFEIDNSQYHIETALLLDRILSHLKSEA